MEVELSSVLCYYHQKNKIHWDKVPLYKPDAFSINEPIEKKSNISAGELIKDKGFMSCEWPLVALTQDETDKWGSMRIDLIYISDDSASLILFENKIGSSFTCGNSQLDRYVKYLNKRSFAKQFLIIITSEDLCKKGWYYTELLRSLNQPDNDGIEGYISFWEDIFSALITD